MAEDSGDTAELGEADAGREFVEKNLPHFVGVLLRG
jgi:hypothetical protein